MGATRLARLIPTFLFRNEPRPGHGLFSFFIVVRLQTRINTCHSSASCMLCTAQLYAVPGAGSWARGCVGFCCLIPILTTSHNPRLPGMDVVCSCSMYMLSVSSHSAPSPTTSVCPLWGSCSHRLDCLDPFSSHTSSMASVRASITTDWMPILEPPDLSVTKVLFHRLQRPRSSCFPSRDLHRFPGDFLKAAAQGPRLEIQARSPPPTPSPCTHCTRSRLLVPSQVLTVPSYLPKYQHKVTATRATSAQHSTLSTLARQDNSLQAAC